MDQKCDFTFGWDFEVLQSESKVLDQKVDQSTRMNITNRLLCYLCLSIFVERLSFGDSFGLNYAY